MSDVSSAVVIASLVEVGASFTGLTLIATVSVSLLPGTSLDTIVRVSAPL